MPEYAQENRPLRVALGDLDPGAALITRFAGTEAVSKLFSFTLDLLSDNHDKRKIQKIVTSGSTGEPLAFFADEGHLTDVRTAAVAAMVARELGRTGAGHIVHAEHPLIPLIDNVDATLRIDKYVGGRSEGRRRRRAGQDRPISAGHVIEAHDPVVAAVGRVDPALAIDRDAAEPHELVGARAAAAECRRAGGTQPHHPAVARICNEQIPGTVYCDSFGRADLSVYCWSAIAGEARDSDSSDSVNDPC